jgi:hypothetical protein
MSSEPAPASEQQWPPSLRWWLLTVVLLAAAISLRIAPLGRLPTPGPDETFYSIYVKQLKEVGLLGYHELFDQYISFQSEDDSPLVLPPSRVTFLVACHLWSSITGREALQSVYDISALSTVAFLLLCAFFAARLSGHEHGLIVLLLVGVAPMQLYMAQRALIDGFFALVALLGLWLLWESLRTGRRRNFAGFALATAALVATKENAVFVFVGYLAAACAYLISLGKKPSAELAGAFVTGPLMGTAALIIAAAGIEPLWQALNLNVQKSLVSPYAHATGNGPWHRYLIDLIIVSPAVTLLAISSLGSKALREKNGMFLAAFLASTYILMCQVKLGMNLRYTLIWDFTLRWFAAVLVLQISRKTGFGRLIFTLTLLVVAASELWQAETLFRGGRVYDPVPAATLQALDILPRAPHLRD